MCQKVERQGWKLTSRHPELHLIKQWKMGCLIVSFHPCLSCLCTFWHIHPYFIPQLFLYLFALFFCTISNHNVSEMHNIRVAYTVTLLHLWCWRPIPVEYSTPGTGLSLTVNGCSSPVRCPDIAWLCCTSHPMALSSDSARATINAWATTLSRYRVWKGAPTEMILVLGVVTL